MKKYASPVSGHDLKNFSIRQGTVANVGDAHCESLMLQGMKNEEAEETASPELLHSSLQLKYSREVLYYQLKLTAWRRMAEGLKSLKMVSS